jgi:O-antigen ligase
VLLSLDINLVIINNYRNLLYAVIVCILFYALYKNKQQHISRNKKKYLIIIITLLVYVIYGTIINKLNRCDSSYLPFLMNSFVLVSILYLDSFSIIKTLNLTLNKLFYYIVIINLPIFIIGLTNEDTIMGSIFHGSVPFLLPLLLVIPLLTKDIKKLLIGLIMNIFFVVYIPKTTTIILYIIDFLIIIIILTNVVKYKKTLLTSSLCTIVVLFPYFFNKIVELSVSFKDSSNTVDSSLFRASVWGLALDQVSQSPFFGNYYSKNTAVFVPTLQEYLPVHNDYIELYFNGGLLGVTLFMSFIGLIIFNQVALIQKVKENRKSLYPIYLVIFIAFMNYLVHMAFNPVMNQTPWGFVSFFIIGVLLTFEDYVKSSSY